MSHEVLSYEALEQVELEVIDPVEQQLEAVPNGFVRQQARRRRPHNPRQGAQESEGRIVSYKRVRNTVCICGHEEGVHTSVDHGTHKGRGACKVEACGCPSFRRSTVTGSASGELIRALALVAGLLLGILIRAAVRCSVEVTNQHSQQHAIEEVSKHEQR